MLRLRKILLCNYLYYSIFVLSAVVLLIRLNTTKVSIYKDNMKSFTGIVEDIIIKDNKLTITLNNKERVIGTYYLKKDEKLFSIQLGDKIKVSGIFNRPKKNSTNYLFNYREYCKRKNIYYLVKIDDLKKIASNRNFYYYLKQKSINYLEHPYLKTFLLGDKRFINDDVKRSYQENGISHLFAISGMHITLLVNLISKLLKKFGIKEKNIFIFTIIFLLIYLSLIGPAPSIVRGVMFYFFFSINKIYYFYIKPVNLFLLIISISLFINPNYIFDAGYLYSYSISFTLISLSDSLLDNNYFKALLKVSFYAFLVSVPITIYYFYQINLLGIIYNLIFVPLVSLIIFPLSLIVVIFKPIEPIYQILIKLLESLSLLLCKIYIGKLIFKRVNILIYFIYFILLLFYVIFKRKKFLIVFFLILTIHYCLPFFDQRQYIKMIDVGQGDSILLHSKSENILVDTGGFEGFGVQNKDGSIFFNTLQPLFRSEGIKKIDYLILTHGDKDHLGEADTLINNMKVDKIIINDNKMNYYEKKLPKEKVKKGVQGYYIHLNSIKMIQLNEDLEDENDSSQIYYVDFSGIKILLTGDASKRSEEVLLKNYDIGKIDILKAGHHGSKTSTSKELLEAIKPKLVLISCGKDNKFKHPSSETINILNKYNIPYLRTDDVGTISIDLNSKKIITEGKNIIKKRIM